MLGWPLTCRMENAASAAVLRLASHMDAAQLPRLVAAYALGRSCHPGRWRLGKRATAAVHAALQRVLPSASPTGVAACLLSAPKVLPPEQIRQLSSVANAA